MKLLLDPQIFSWQAYGGISNQFANLFKIWSNQQLPVDLPVSYSYNTYLLQNKHLLPNAKLISPKEYSSSMWAGAGKLGKILQIILNLE